MTSFRIPKIYKTKKGRYFIKKKKKIKIQKGLSEEREKKFIK